MKSFIRWAGSKTQILHELRDYWIDDEATYIEPFCGSASLFFDICPKKAILGDLNSDLTNALRAIQQNPSVVWECVQRRKVSEKAYYALRSIDPASLCETERAARFIYLNRYCFNGLYRTNLDGKFNVPYGGNKPNMGVDEEMIFDASEALQNAQIINADFEVTLGRVQSGDFVYMDPPYIVSTRRVFSEYLPGSFHVNDLNRLVAELEKLEKAGAKFLVSYADSKEGRKLLSAWKTRKIQVRRNIAGFAGARRRAYELLATNCI